MGLQYNEINDAVLLTQQTLIQRGAFVDLQTDLTDHVAVREMWQGRRHAFAGGNPWEFDVQIDHNHSARSVELYETDGSSINDTMIKGTSTPRHVNAHYIYDQREPAFQRGGASIVDLIETRTTAMQVSWFEYLEGKLWSKPTDSTDTKTPYGLQMYVVKNATEGFNGGNPAGFADGVCGISSTTYPRWANYTGSYATVSPEDLVRKMRRMFYKINFRSVVSHAQPTIGSMKNGIYCNADTLLFMEELLESQNTNLGTDLDSQGGRVVFKSSPVIYAPKLDDESDDPVYMLDWKWLAIGVLEGWENQLSAPHMLSDRHLVYRVDLDASLQMCCTNRRQQGVLYKA
jgi:hypothetical protein